MSNKTQLQTNNTTLASLTDRVLAAKDTAAALPDAGSGGGAVETCTVTVNNNCSISASHGSIDIEYTDNSFELTSILSPKESSIECIVTKNTLFAVFGESVTFEYEVTGDIYDYIVADGILVCEVMGDGTVTITN